MPKQVTAQTNGTRLSYGSRKESVRYGTHKVKKAAPSHSSLIKIAAIGMATLAISWIAVSGKQTSEHRQAWAAVNTQFEGIAQIFRSLFEIIAG